MSATPGGNAVSTIAAKLVAAMSEIDAVTKEGQNETQRYKYVRASDVANEVRKVLVKHRIAFTYSVANTERWQTDRFNKEGTIVGVMNYVQATVLFTFTDADSGTGVEMTGVGCGQDTGEKAIYKAMTGALKYALRMNFIIPDESDPENEKAEFIAEVERQKQNPSKEPQTITVNDRLNASIKQETEKRVAEERNKLAAQQGEFSIDGDILTCVVKGIQKKKGAKGEFVSVTFNGRLANGANFASCFDKEIAQALEACLDKKCKLQLKHNGQYTNITDVVWFEGIPA